MITMDEVQEMLDEIAGEFPYDFFKELNGGIILLPEVKPDTKSMDDDLYILGEYNRSINMGRYIAIYYGSFIRLYGHLDRRSFRERIKNTIKHEFTHHLESLAGERELERKDMQFIRNYLDKKTRR